MASDPKHSKFSIKKIVALSENLFIMLKNISKTDKILLILALGTLIFSELMWFQGEKDGALFVGLWVPSILGFAIYLKLLRAGK
jgi:hypothetical protein